MISKTWEDKLHVPWSVKKLEKLHMLVNIMKLTDFAFVNLKDKLHVSKFCVSIQLFNTHINKICSN